MCSLSLLISLCTACKQTPSANSGDSATPQVIKVENMDYAHSDDVFEHIRFLPLETNDTCLIRWVSQIKLNDSLIFINDYWKRILVFDLSSGKFKRQIGRTGKGPEEYLEVSDFLINKDTVEILDYRKIECYSLQGKHLKSKRFPHLMQEKEHYNPKFFAKTPDNGYYFWERRLGETAAKNPLSYFMYQVDSGFHVTRTAFPVIRSAGGNHRMFINYEDKILVDPLFANPNLYQIDAKGDISIRYTVDFGDKTPVPEEVKDLDMADLLDLGERKVLNMDSYVENKNWVHLNVSWKHFAHSLFYNKHTHKTYLLSARNASNHDFRTVEIRTSYKEQMVESYPADWFLREKERLSAAAHKKYQLDTPILQAVKEDDNPIILFYTLK